MFLFPALPPAAPTGPNRSKLQDMLANLRDAEDPPSMQPPVACASRAAVPRLNEQDLGRPDDGKLPFFSSSLPLLLHRLHTHVLLKLWAVQNDGRPPPGRRTSKYLDKLT